MSALAVRHGPGGPAAEAPQPRLFALPGGRQASSGTTLDHVLSSAWTALGRGDTAPCPVCAGELAPRWSAGAGAVGGRCRSCGTTID